MVGIVNTTLLLLAFYGIFAMLHCKMRVEILGYIDFR